jgi:two-component system LytT family sensor kinase
MMTSRIDKKRIVAHALFWIFYLLYILLDEGWMDRDYIVLRYSPQIWTETLVAITLVYTNLYFLMPRYLYPKQYARYATGLILLMLAGGLTTRCFMYLYWIPWESIHEPIEYANEATNFYIPVRIIRNSLGFYPVMAVTMLIKITNNSYQHERRLRQMEQEKFNAELNFLKAQMHPHFFFNTLNTLYALTLKKSEQSPEVVLRLSGLMQYILYDTNTDFVQLETDIKHVKDYTGIEEIRFADRLEFSFHYSGDMAGKIIAPLILLPFVENAFKHSLRDETEKAWIVIDIKVVGDRLFFKSENSCRPKELAPATNKGHRITNNGPTGKNGARLPANGVGLANVRRRLELTYPNRHELNIDHGDFFYRVECKLQLNEKD